jgi:hypothetical protein
MILIEILHASSLNFIVMPTRNKNYAKAVLKFAKLNTAAQQREAVVQGRSLLPYRLRYIFRNVFVKFYARTIEKFF